MLVPPLQAGAVNVIDAVVAQTVAVPIVGAPGVENVLIPELDALALPVPAEFVALTENVYPVPVVSPDTTIGEDVFDDETPVFDVAV
jgi:hypothetical protein